MSENHICVGATCVPIQHRSVIYLLWNAEVPHLERQKATENLNSRLKHWLKRLPLLVDASGNPYGRTSSRLMVNSLIRHYPNGTLILEVNSDNREGLEFLITQAIVYLNRHVPVTIATE